MKTLLPRRVRSKLRAAYWRGSYFGFRYRCPFCRARLKTFLAFGLTFPVLEQKQVVGGGYRKNGLCPICGSTDRERLLYLYLLNKTDVFRTPRTILHVAPEESLARVLRPTAREYVTADLSGDGVTVGMDITNLGFRDAAFDVVICNHVLEHIVDDGRAMSELYRILKPGGWAILQVPISLTLQSTYEDFAVTTRAGREEAFGQPNHVRIYAKDYRDRLSRAGFDVTVFEWSRDAERFGGRRNLFGLNEEESVYCAGKHP